MDFSGTGARAIESARVDAVLHDPLATLLLQGSSKSQELQERLSQVRNLQAKSIVLLYTALLSARSGEKCICTASHSFEYSCADCTKPIVMLVITSQALPLFTWYFGT